MFISCILSLTVVAFYMFPMLLTPHTLAGLVIAYEVKDPLLALPLALASHFALDLIPHWDFLAGVKEVTGVIKKRILGDFLVALTLGLWICLRQLPDVASFWRFIFCAFLANLPDGLEMPKSIFGKDLLVSRLIYRFQHVFHRRAPYPIGLLPQAILIGLALLLLLG